MNLDQLDRAHSMRVELAALKQERDYHKQRMKRVILRHALKSQISDGTCAKIAKLVEEDREARITDLEHRLRALGIDAVSQKERDYEEAVECL